MKVRLIQDRVTILTSLPHLQTQSGISLVLAGLEEICGLYYKHMMIVNDDSSIVIKLSFKLLDAARGIIYDHHMFKLQATVCSFEQLALCRIIMIYEEVC
jgi:hypothetical protein